MKELAEIMSEYRYDDDIFCEDSDRVMKCKKALSKQPMSDRIIMCIYAEAASIRKVAQVLGISTSLAYNEIKRIQGNIISEL